MNTLKRIRAIGLRALALVGALVALTLIINLPWFDEELHPELARFLPPQPVSIEGNAFVYAYGFAAANDQDPHATGVEIIENLRERYRSGEWVRLSPEEMNDLLGNPPEEDWIQAYTPSYSSCDSRRELDCAERWIADIAEANVIDERLTVLLNRFETMLTLDRFEEIMEADASSPFPAFQPVMAVSRIRLAMAIDDQPTDLVLDRIGADIRFWKMMLRDGDWLISAMLGLGGLRNSTQLLSALMRTRDLSPTELARIAEILTPLSTEERDIGDVFLGESGYVMRSVFRSHYYTANLAWLLAFQKNATMNDYYEAFTVPMRQRAALSASEHYEQMGEPYESYEVPLFPPPLYNLGGKYFFRPTLVMNAATGYISRVHDLDGRIALVLLQAELLANPDEPIERVVARSQYRNPYTREPMEYDATSGILSFECLGTPGEFCAVAIGRD